MERTYTLEEIKIYLLTETTLEYAIDNLIEVNVQSALDEYIENQENNLQLKRDTRKFIHQIALI